MEESDQFNSRDISWLHFNQRVLEESEKSYVPLLERLQFLAIYSSNLDEFYRVRMPVLGAWKKIKKKKESNIHHQDLTVLKKVKKLINRQQTHYGTILTEKIIPALRDEDIFLIYGEAIPENLVPTLRDYFYGHISAFLVITDLQKQEGFFPVNSQLYFFVLLKDNAGKFIVKIPSEEVSRFVELQENGRSYVLFIDGIIRRFLTERPEFSNIENIFSFKVTRDAEIDIGDHYQSDIAEAIEKEIAKREYGLAVRLLYEQKMPKTVLLDLLQYLNLDKKSAVAGGLYHNLKDFFHFPVWKSDLAYPVMEQLRVEGPKDVSFISIFDRIKQEDILLHTPYQSYDTVLRFFNEAAIDSEVAEIYTTMYRVAKDSRIAQALMTASRNGKKVFVFVELKARFDEENNVRWARLLKAAGVYITYSIPKLKVHAKVALAIRRISGGTEYLGLFSTGNLNEKTARVYTDHSLLTANQTLLKELHQLFLFLPARRVKLTQDELSFDHLLVAHFNLLDRFIQLINDEIAEAMQGKPASLFLKLNNLEEEKLIQKLHEASQAGVEIRLLVRGICRLRPGLGGLSENIKVKRIVGRFLEHGRVFYFHHRGRELLYLGSADWMVRNIHRRLEVCFPILLLKQKQQLRHILELQWKDDASSVWIGKNSENIPLENPGLRHAQQDIYDYLKSANHEHQPLV